MRYGAVMELSEWRKAKKISFDECAALFGITGKNPGRTLQRYETGENKPKSEMMLRIETATEGKVTVGDQLKTRMNWKALREAAQ